MRLPPTRRVRSQRLQCTVREGTSGRHQSARSPAFQQRVTGRAAAEHDQPWRVGAPETAGVGVSTQILRPLDGCRYTRQLSRIFPASFFASLHPHGRSNAFVRDITMGCALIAKCIASVRHPIFQAFQRIRHLRHGRPTGQAKPDPLLIIAIGPIQPCEGGRQRSKSREQSFLPAIGRGRSKADGLLAGEGRLQRGKTSFGA